MSFSSHAAITACLLMLGTIVPSAAHAQLLPTPENVVSLAASASAERPNDWLTVVLDTRREGDDAVALQAELKQALDSALAEARPLAQPGQLELRTGNFALAPRYVAQDNRHAGWTGRAELIVEGRDTAAVAKLAGRIRTLTIANVSWSLSRQAREQAEEAITGEAITQFRAKADAVARAFGFSGWRLREVNVGSESPRGYTIPRTMAMASRSTSDAPLPTEAGQATVTVNVNGSVQLTR